MPIILAAYILAVWAVILPLAVTLPLVVTVVNAPLLALFAPIAPEKYPTTWLELVIVPLVVNVVNTPLFALFAPIAPVK